MKYLPYDSRDLLYKSVFGAVKTDEEVRFRVLLHRDIAPLGVFMLIRRDGMGYYPCEMKQAGRLDESHLWYEYKTVFGEAGLCFYKFRYTTVYGDCYVTRGEFSEGHEGEGGEWQLTVYEEDAVPSGFAGGVIYQIFPDRFFRSGKKKKDVPEDRFIRDDWGGLPAYRQDGEKFSLGNDYFGGDLKGIEKKLPYLESLGVTAIYLNPIFEAHSNHRYNTADYEKTDPLLGTEKDFSDLCAAAKKRGIAVIFDGVFSHTGSDSRYFNKNGRYEGKGAAESETSPCRSWYKFDSWPDSYSCWWGVPTLPETDENDPSFREYITGENGIVAKWLRAGASGVRLDVADELPDEFLDALTHRVRSVDPNALIIGEVWEDATNKISYGQRRRYLLGGQLDSVMNYPFARLILSFVLGGDAFRFMDGILEICENYPSSSLGLLMNHIGTHDTARVLTYLGKGGNIPASRPEQAEMSLTEEEYARGKALLRLASFLQYTLPGIPSLYYGDEAGATGGCDPFCRGCYPWGKEDAELIAHYKSLGAMRRELDAFSGGFRNVFAGLGLVAYERIGKTSSVLAVVNRWREDDTFILPEKYRAASVVFGNAPTGDTLKADAYGFALLAIKND